MSGSQSATAHVGALLEAYHARTLPATEAERVEWHLRDCASCRELSEQIALYQIIRAAPAPLPGPELRRGLYARIAAASSRASERQRRLEAPTLRRARSPIAAPPDHAHGRRATPGWLSGAVAVIVVALIASVIWALPHVRGRGNDVTQRTGTPTNAIACPAGATSVALPAHALLNDMALTSPTSGWAVGALENDKGNVTQALIMRFSQCHWTPISFDLPGISLSAISMDSATDGWAAGSNASATATVLLHYSGGVWSRVVASNHLLTQGSASVLAMSAPNDGWFVTIGPGVIQQAYVAAAAQTLFHDSQGTWTRIASPLEFMDAIAPVGPDDVWIAGENFVGSSKALTHSFAHYQNGHWTVVAQPAGLMTSRLYVVSPTDIWASGMDESGHPIIAHYDGATWQNAPQALPSVAPHTYGFVVAEGAGAGWAYTFRQITTRVPGALPQPLVANVWRETGGQWQSLNWSYTDIAWINTWSSFPDGEVWAIGSYYMYSPATPDPGGGSSVTGYKRTVLLHYVNGAWSRYGG